MRDDHSHQLQTRSLYLQWAPKAKALSPKIPPLSPPHKHPPTPSASIAISLIIFNIINLHTLTLIKKIIIHHQIPPPEGKTSILGIAVKSKGSICCSTLTLSPFLFSDDLEERFIKEFNRDFGFYLARISEFSFTISFISRRLRGGGGC